MNTILLSSLNIPLKENVSQSSYLRLGFYFITKSVKLLEIFVKT